MADATQFDLDGNGDIITKPVIGWATHVVAGIAGLLVIQYVDSMDQFETGGKKIQLVLTPAQSLELAEALKKLGNKVLALPSPEGRLPS